MAVPKRKQSRARTRSRCTHHAEQVKSITHCLNCSNPLSTHQVCAACGFYKGVKVMATKADRAVKRGNARQAKEARTNATQQEPTIQAEAEAPKS